MTVPYSFMNACSFLLDLYLQGKLQSWGCDAYMVKGCCASFRNSIGFTIVTITLIFTLPECLIKKIDEAIP